jgi:hypothetical protein
VRQSEVTLSKIFRRNYVIRKLTFSEVTKNNIFNGITLAVFTKVFLTFRRCFFSLAYYVSSRRKLDKKM